MDKLKVGILIFDGVEVLDFAGPFEVFSRTRLEPGVPSRRSEDSAPFETFTVATKRKPLLATGGLEVTPRFGFEDAPPIDLLIVPGGFGTRALLDDQPTLDWIKQVASNARLTASVCTGALLLARCGLLAGQAATTHWAAYDTLAELDASIKVRRDTRVVGGSDPADAIVTSAGVAAGIDMAFRVVELLCGRAVAVETAHYIEYPRSR